jgi:hypothetical protein
LVHEAINKITTPTATMVQFFFKLDVVAPVVVLLSLLLRPQLITPERHDLSVWVELPSAQAKREQPESRTA